MEWKSGEILKIYKSFEGGKITISRSHSSRALLNHFFGVILRDKSEKTVFQEVLRAFKAMNPGKKSNKSGFSVFVNFLVALSWGSETLA